jgi:hypothetical protein
MGEISMAENAMELKKRGIANSKKKHFAEFGDHACVVICVLVEFDRQNVRHGALCPSNSRYLQQPLRNLKLVNSCNSS